ncbi:hypothetical protein MVEN_01657600 [Mycena venus]|uniref:F-box domain-containing protein n=1 Tax=Mycena venus TaxID=2733690 RepID=A0A8H7CP43_9AGAR|nr:hypothetical protein MVEN_01657600 [Mycena venus]
MYTQSSRIGISQTILPSRAREAREGTPQGRTTQSAKALTLSDLHALVMKLEARLVAQDEKITVLQRENSELWQEVHRLKGPRLPLEIFLLIVKSARDDKKALKNFSLVCKSWMQVARNILFARISLNAMFWYVKIKPGPILNSPHCTVFPHVRTIDINGSMDDGSDHFAFRTATWMDDVLVHMPKFTALTSLGLLQPGIMGLRCHRPGHTAIAVFISKFAGLTTLECGEIDRAWEDDLVTNFLTNDSEPLAPPPSSITNLVMCESGHLPSSILKWFTDLHFGVIESFVPSDLSTSNPANFKSFMDRFGGSFSNIKLSISGHDKAVQFLDSQYLVILRQLKSIELRFWVSALDCLPRTFAQLPPSIEEITLFLINFGDPDQLSHRECAATWSQLDRTLAGTKFLSLRSLSIVCDRMHFPDFNNTSPTYVNKTQQPFSLPIIAVTSLTQH